jgi:hypothetical protein
MKHEMLRPQNGKWANCLMIGKGCQIDKRALLLFCLTVGITVAATENPTMQPPANYQNFALPRPAGMAPISKDEIRIDSDRVFRVLKSDPPGVTRDSLKQQAEKLLDPQAFDEYWSSCVPIVNWELPGRNLKMFRYLGMTAAKLHLFSGNPKVARYIHDYMMESAAFDAWFWIGRTNYAEKHWATLQTAYKVRDYINVLLYARDVFSPDELNLLEEKLRYWGHQTSLNWTKQRRTRGNWIAVVCGGLLRSSLYFNDLESKSLAIERLKTYVDTSIEDDGSYGEHLHYFHYGMGAMMTPFSLLNQRERRTLFADSNLRHAPDWAIYHYFFKKIYPGQRYLFKAGFGDNNYYEGARTDFYGVLADLYESQSAAFLDAQITGTPWQGPAPALPLFRTFKNGTTFIRSGWDSNATVFAIHMNTPCKLISHQRAENGNFVLGAYGLPIVMHSGNTNRYFDPIHQYEIKTSVANTILIDGKNQIKPADAKALSYRLAKSGQTADVVILDLKAAYKPTMTRVERTVAHLRKRGLFVIIDRLESGDEQPHVYDSRLHLNNIRHDATLDRDGNHFLYRHPLAQMRIVTGCDSGNVNRLEKSFVCSDLYDKFDKRQDEELARGNAIRLIYGNPKPRKASILFAVMRLSQPGDAKELSASFKDGVLTVGSDTIRLLSNGVSVTADGVAEDFMYAQQAAK